MAEPRYKGVVGVRQVHYSRDRDEINGWVTTIKYRGALASILLAQEDEFYVEGASKSRVTQNGDSEQDGFLTVIFNAKSQDDASSDDPEVNEFSNTWTFAQNREQIEIWKLPKYRDLADVESGWLERIIQAVEDYKRRVADAISSSKAETAITFVLTDVLELPSGISGDQIVTSSELSSLLLAGKTTADRDRYVLRNVRVVPGNTSLTADHANVNEMWSNDRLIELVNSSAASITQRAIIGDLSNSFADTYWFKSAPEINEMTNGRFEIVSEFTNYEDGEFEVVTNPKFE